METAMKLSVRYVLHSCREGVTSKDILLCLQYVALQDKGFWEDDEIKKKIAKYIEEELKDDNEIKEEDLKYIDDICVIENEEKKQNITNDKLSEKVKLLFPFFRNSGLDANESALKSIEAAKRGIQSGKVFCKSICPCNICNKINNSEERWESWEPQTVQAKLIYNALQNTINKFNDDELS